MYIIYLHSEYLNNYNIINYNEKNSRYIDTDKKTKKIRPLTTDTHRNLHSSTQEIKL